MAFLAFCDYGASGIARPGPAGAGAPAGKSCAPADEVCLN